MLMLPTSSKARTGYSKSTSNSSMYAGSMRSDGQMHRSIRFPRIEKPTEASHRSPTHGFEISNDDAGSARIIEIIPPKLHNSSLFVTAKRDGSQASIRRCPAARPEPSPAR